MGTFPLQGTLQDLLAHRPWHDPSQDRAWKGRPQEAPDLRGSPPSIRQEEAHGHPIGSEVPRLLEEALQRQAFPWTFPLQGSLQDLLAHRPWHDPSQDRAWKGRPQEAPDLRGSPPSI